MDSSLLLDRSVGADDFMPSLPQSTPKRNRKINFTCVQCGKTYEKKFYYEKHLDSHKVGESLAATGDQPSIHLNISSVSFTLLQPASDPNQTGTDHNNNAAAFKKPKKVVVKKVKKKPAFVCTYCLKGYVCSKSFKTHIRLHAVQDGAARYPDKAVILRNLEEISMEALTTVSKAPCYGQAGTAFKQIVGHIIVMSSQPSGPWLQFCEEICESLLNSVIGEKFILPSKLFGCLVDQVENFLSDPSQRDSVMKTLNLAEDFHEQVQCQFLLEFVLSLSRALLRFISNTIRVNYQRSVTPKVVEELDKDDRETIYYIGGSIMHGYLKIGYRYMSCTRWASIVNALKSKFLCDRVASQSIADSSWTRSLDRGGLVYVTQECHNFFLAVTKVVASSVKRDGSIDYEEVVTKVCKSDIRCMWDDIAFNSLNHDLSLDLLNDVVESFCKTCGRGFAKQKLNVLRSRPVVSMALRHQTASRKKK